MDRQRCVIRNRSLWCRAYLTNGPDELRDGVEPRWTSDPTAAQTYTGAEVSALRLRRLGQVIWQSRLVG
jgi:hypothetical protein